MERSREEKIRFLVFEVFQHLFLTAAGGEHMSSLRSLCAASKLGPLCALLKTPDGRNALHMAAYNGKTTACRFLIEELKFDINSIDNMGDTPLFNAIWEGHRPTAEFLIENGADVTISNRQGATPLHYTAKQGSEEIAEMLISNGADVNATSRAGTPLHLAAKHGNVDVLKSLLNRNANPNSISPMHTSPLLVSVAAGSIECMELLLEAKADPNDHCSGFLTTPLCLAAAIPTPEMIRGLLYHDVNPDLEDCTGTKAIEYAALRGHREVVEVLYPVTSRITWYPDWSISGIMQYARSKEAFARGKPKRKEIIQQGKAKGNEAFRKGDYLEAVNWYSRAALIDPGNAIALSNRSLCWTRLNEGENALADAKTCIELTPSRAKSHYREGAAWKILKDYEKAAEAFHRALALKPRKKKIRDAYREAKAEHKKGLLLQQLLEEWGLRN